MTATPRGIGQPAKAVEAFQWAVNEMQKRYKSVDIAWGEVHRVRRGTVNEPVGGCSGALGCFRVLTYEQLPDGTRAANSGDGWILAVEFGAQAPRAYSILAYGQSADSTSPHYSDQAAMFARGPRRDARPRAHAVGASQRQGQDHRERGRAVGNVRHQAHRSRAGSLRDGR
ncbi:MAG: hypothetical protein CK550_04580 [Gemmatimonadetes bacterium]|nr:MAG: hypothetical protein CK550_04580 [Gemmatimonadota bacterium]